eukprot:CAMPEP_0202828140 /NCGR_PEP_ID=MMETSP1389-20130828/14754_1 /ASSEMBLY_ACC=CAM_ASM_000865 /TAXON_ID=302021 /ORGANISM="Rhodomonas sp., Strain CCMP768" /LENGTH=35 /DNA_ID= /DNA_START= /DNA_END= /DNA_ORIENTATION=
MSAKTTTMQAMPSVPRGRRSVSRREGWGAVTEAKG